MSYQENPNRKFGSQNNVVEITGGNEAIKAENNE